MSEATAMGEVFIREKVCVRIEHTDETGGWVYAVVVHITDDFWLGAFPTRREAVEFCTEKDLPIVDRYFVSDCPMAGPCVVDRHCKENDRQRHTIYDAQKLCDELNKEETRVKSE